MNEAPARDPAPYASLTARSTTPARALARAVAAACGAVAAAVSLVAALVAVQGRSADVRHADAIVVVGSPCGAGAGACPAPAVLDHAVDLFRRGYAARVLIAADNAEAARSHLLAAGLPADALLAPEPAPTPWERARSAAATLRAGGLQTALLVGRPSDMLLALKMTRDQGLTVYAAPGGAAPGLPPVGALLAEALSYWRYVLLGA